MWIMIKKLNTEQKVVIKGQKAKLRFVCVCVCVCVCLSFFIAEKSTTGAKGLPTPAPCRGGGGNQLKTLVFS